MKVKFTNFEKEFNLFKKDIKSVNKVGKSGNMFWQRIGQI